MGLVLYVLAMPITICRTPEVLIDKKNKNFELPYPFLYNDVSNTKSEAVFGGNSMRSMKVGKTSAMTGALERTAEIFAENNSFIRSAIRFHVSDEAERDDLFQELFLSLIASPVPADVKNIKGFLFRVIAFRAKDAFRRKSTYQKKLCGYAENCKLPSEIKPESNAVKAEELEKVLNMVRTRLPKHEAAAISLAFRDDSSNIKAAKSMGLKTETINRYVCTGIKKLSSILKKERVSS